MIFWFFVLFYGFIYFKLYLNWGIMVLFIGIKVYNVWEVFLDFLYWVTRFFDVFV